MKKFEIINLLKSIKIFPYLFEIKECHDFIHRYQFADQIVECENENCPGWEKSFTNFGACCSFNYSPLNVSNVIILNQADKFGGLNILLAGEEVLNEGVMLYLTPAGEFITSESMAFLLIPVYDNFFRIYARSDIVSTHYSNLGVKIRKCFLPEDGDPVLVNQHRCRLACATRAAYQLCQCHPFFMAFIEEDSKHMRNCTLNDLACLTNTSGEIAKYIHSKRKKWQ